MSTPPAELIFLPLKSSVRPEDDSSEEGKAFLELLVDKGPLFEGIVWGRSIENSDIVGIGIDLQTSGPSFPLAAFLPFQASPPQTLLVSDVKVIDLASNPVTEIAIMPLIEHLTEEDIMAVNDDAETFGRAILTAPAPAPYSYQIGWAAGKVKNRLVMMIGWSDIQNHIDATKTLLFQDKLKPVLEKVAGELNIRHFHLQAVSSK